MKHNDEIQDLIEKARADLVTLRAEVEQLVAENQILRAKLKLAELQAKSADKEVFE